MQLHQSSALKKIFTAFITILFIFITQANAATNPLVNLPSNLNGKSTNSVMIPSAPNVDAKSYILIDAKSGAVIAATDADEHLPPASMTKLMTLYVIFNAIENGQIKLDDSVRISRKAWQTPGSRMFLKQGDNVPVNKLIQGIIVDSGNDACVAMAEYVAGSEDSFVELMNRQAAILGMKDTHFTDSNGLPHPNHYSTARDMAILAKAIINRYPSFYKGFSQKSLTYGGIKQMNRNRLLWRYDYADGLKTGHTQEAGYCLVASAKKDNMRLISVVMGAPSDNARAEDAQRLLTYGFRFYETHKVYSAGAAISRPRVWKGEEGHVEVGLARDLYLTIPAGQFSKLEATSIFKGPLYAPVKRGETLGVLEITLDGKPISKQPLYALHDDPKGGLWTRMSDSVSESVHNFLNKHDKTES